ncbi:MAG: hypothetical protein HOL01_18700 [Planctomycetaceae bacterium]|jgi:hypothetical protein|nr:hypothetical protein [Planctomycetaceae bacterium]MBT6484171.1 hypothetical protein [Planctomycetaceae bacterium]MBT6496568.1 hypothetical protein [Planctomycetaceae bacterium]
MKKLMILPIALAMLSVTGGGSQAGLLDGLFDSETTAKNPKTYGRIVWQQNGPKDARIALASFQPAPPPGIRLAPGEYIVPTPEGDTAIAPAPAGQPIGLYHRVKYEDLDNIHPCAVKMVVQVMDPCPPPRDPCSRCKPAPRFVLVEICVPRCGCKKVKVSRGGAKVEYDYGKYEIEIKSKKGVVVVNYDD